MRVEFLCDGEGGLLRALRVAVCDAVLVGRDEACRDMSGLIGCLTLEACASVTWSRIASKPLIYFTANK